MPRVRALNVLDFAQAAQYGVLYRHAEDHGEKWWRNLEVYAKGETDTSIMFGTMKQNVESLKEWAAHFMGRGFSVN
jgi:hypothetical protein